MAVSNSAGMGSIPNKDFTAFRVWAPHAKSVSVAGTFNNWDINAAPMTSENNGYWSVDVPNAHIGDQYKFVIVNADTGAVLWKNDPYARELTTDETGTKGII